MAGGKPGSTPAAIVRRCSWPDQTVIHCRLDEVASVMAQQRVRPPVLVVVGEVVSHATAQTWFTSRPLFGTRVLVTRPAEQATHLRTLLEEQGAEVLVQPAIEIRPPDDWSAVDSALARLNEFDWLVFSSANGVRAVLERILHSGADLRRLGGIRLAAIGPGTAEELASYHLKADLVPDEYRAERLADDLAGQGRGARFLLARASRGREVLSERLTAAGASVQQIVVYQSRDVAEADGEVKSALATGQIDWVTVTSSAIARSLVNLFGEDLRRARLASISPITSQTLGELGFSPAAEASQYTMPGIVQAILAATQGRR
jgi:uroporphyrinogen III methyltransferase/synthase